MKFQLRHHGIEIPAEQQPRCPICGGFMSLHRMECNDNVSARWYCLHADYDPESECPGGEVEFEDWIATAAPELQEHFAGFYKTSTELLLESLRAAGFERVAGHIWGGGFWGEFRPSDKEFWTGYGGTLEYWRPPEGWTGSKPDPVVAWLGG